MAFRKRVNQAELSRILGVSHQAIAKMKPDPSFPEFDKGGLAEIYAVCVWWYMRKEANPVPTDETLLAGDDSDGLERYRQARAAQEEIKLAQTRGQVIMLNDFEDIAPALFGPLRRVAEHIKRKGDSDTLEVIEEANREVLASLERLYGHEHTTSETGVD
jgi:phage terminase Nu1 subunit (DNA packaging protein)